MQRLFRIAPTKGRYTIAKALLQSGYESAWQIQQQSSSEFIAAMSTELGSLMLARLVYARAGRQASSALAAFSVLSTGMQGPPVAMMPSIRKMLAVTGDGTDVSVDTGDFSAVDTSEIPGYDAMFGNQDYCEPIHSASVLSPAAYFVDLLQFLNDLKKSGTTAQVELLSSTRRSDLATLLLSRDNTETTLPVIDLVNELLANAIDSGVAIPVETVGSASERRAVPQADLSGADNELATPVWPLALPYHRTAQTTWVHLDHLNLSLADLDLVASPDLSASPTPWYRQAWAGTAALTRLQILPAEWSVIADDATSSVADRLGVTSLSSLMADAKEFVARLELEPDAIYDLVAIAALDLNVSPDIAAPCDFSSMAVVSAGGSSSEAERAGKTLALVRIAKRLDWSLSQTGRVLAAVDAWTSPATNSWFSAATPQALAIIKELSNRAGIDPLELATLWGRMDTEFGRVDRPDDRSLYARRFLASQLDSGMLTVLEGLPTNNLGVKFGAYDDTGSVDTALMAGLQLSRSDYDHLLNLNNSGVPQYADTVVTFDGVSDLFGWTMVATLTNLSISQTTSLVGLYLGADPIFDNLCSPGSMASFMEFLAFVKEIRDSPLSIAQAIWLLDSTSGEAAAAVNRSSEDLVDEIRSVWSTLWAASGDAEPGESSARFELLLSTVASFYGVERDVTQAVLEAVTITVPAQSSGADANLTAAAWFVTEKHDASDTGETIRFLDATVAGPEADPSIAIDVSSATALEFWQRISRILTFAAAFSMDAEDTELGLGPSPIGESLRTLFSPIGQQQLSAYSQTSPWSFRCAPSSWNLVRTSPALQPIATWSTLCTGVEASPPPLASTWQTPSAGGGLKRLTHLLSDLASRHRRSSTGRRRPPSKRSLLGWLRPRARATATEVGSRWLRLCKTSFENATAMPSLPTLSSRAHHSPTWPVPKISTRIFSLTQ